MNSRAIKLVKYRNPANDSDVSTIYVVSDCHDLSADELIQMFREFMLACGYGASIVEEYLGAD